MRRTLLILLVLGTTILAGAGVATAETSWSDPPGDGKGAIDITGVTVANDPDGLITMKVVATAVGGSGYNVFLDADLNGNIERAIWGATPVAGVVVPMAFAKDSSDTWSPTTIPSLRGIATPTGAEFSFVKAEVGIDQGFAFWIGTDIPGNDEAWGDEAPDVGMYTYILTAPPPPVKVKPVIEKPVATAAIAGKRMTVTFMVRRSDNGAPMTTGTMTCDPSIAGKALAHRESFARGKAKLSFAVPKTAKGKRVTVKVTIVSTDGLAATRTASFKVR
jgi:hypothetical protein